MKRLKSTGAIAPLLLRTFLLGTSIALLGSCVTVTPELPPPVISVPPEDLDRDLNNLGIYHGVRLVVEFNPENLPQGAEFTNFVVPIRDGARLLYLVTEGEHKVHFAHREFEVAGYRYPSEGGGTLFVFKPRRKFEFKFHGQRVVVNSRVSWRPSIRYTKKLDEVRGVRHLSEVLKIGFATIETNSRTQGVWIVNGREFRPGDDKVLEINNAVQYEG